MVPARDPHALAGKTVMLRLAGREAPGLRSNDSFEVEDWWINVFGRSWMVAEGNPAALSYAVRAAVAGLPIDDDVVYGKVGVAGHLVHDTELGQVA